MVKRRTPEDDAMDATRPENAFVFLMMSCVLTTTLLLDAGRAEAQPRNLDGKVTLGSLQTAQRAVSSRTKSGKPSLDPLTISRAEAPEVATKSGKKTRVVPETHFDDVVPGLAIMPVAQLDAHRKSVALAMASGEGFEHRLKLTMRAVRDLVAFDNRMGKKTATFPVGTHDKLFVDADALWYDMISGKGDGLQFGPYMTNWKRVPSSVGSSQYGVQLGLPW